MPNNPRRRRHTMSMAEEGEHGRSSRSWHCPPAPEGAGGEDAAGAEEPRAEGRPPAPGTPYNDRGAVIVSTDPCVIYDPDVAKNDVFLRTVDVKELEKYMGEWIAIAGGGIVAHGKDPKRVHEEAYDAGKGEPLMHYIATESEGMPFYGLW